MRYQLAKFALLLPILLLVGCETIYFNTMEKVGVHKRDILIDRIEETQESQEDAQEQFKSALEQLRSITNFDGGDLEDLYNKLNDEYEGSAEAAKEINNRINKVESVGEALFDEWRDELKQYTSSKLRNASATKLKTTERKYKKLIAVLRKAERSITPVLNSLKDNSLYLKHNLNARAVASIKGELKSIDADISQLIKQMQTSISESDAFIAQLKS
ncbi:DNA repair protein [Gammaproteobacteria bacterium 45_16_T64]|nr:DNA repair protein [Gammaproteobacteria bacterium 45_16_T64]